MALSNAGGGGTGKNAVEIYGVVTDATDIVVEGSQVTFDHGGQQYTLTNPDVWGGEPPGALAEGRIVTKLASSQTSPDPAVRLFEMYVHYVQLQCSSAPRRTHRATPPHAT